mmetsp:Transcript_64883/g.193371  ORF Transcript_64883/g.193371 Transcript_64883/m.193371 type:complete len:288 (-) Transcript_64883:21-884(-)
MRRRSLVDRRGRVGGRCGRRVGHGRRGLVGDLRRRHVARGRRLHRGGVGRDRRSLHRGSVGRDGRSRVCGCRLHVRGRGWLVACGDRSRRRSGIRHWRRVGHRRCVGLHRRDWRRLIGHLGRCRVGHSRGRLVGHRWRLVAHLRRHRISPGHWLELHRRRGHWHCRGLRRSVRGHRSGSRVGHRRSGVAHDRRRDWRRDPGSLLHHRRLRRKGHRSRLGVAHARHASAGIAHLGHAADLGPRHRRSGVGHDLRLLHGSSELRARDDAVMVAVQDFEGRHGPRGTTKR